MQDQYISAKEVAEFLYCERAWWYRLQGKVDENAPLMRAGAKKHDAIAAQVTQMEQRRTLSHSLLWLGAVLFVIVCILFVLASR
ncbi:MAG: hypothetical protein SF123_05850 [Chloroflexota bacterium]|nr:hypothetical protein [Chloroflexota bacterium]